MAGPEQTADARARLLALLRLADRRSNGFPDERQLALDKALTIAQRGAIAMEDMIEAHRLDVSDLNGPRWRIPHEGSAAALLYPFLVSRYGPNRDPGPPPREAVAGVYPIAGFRHYDGPANRHRMRIDDPVALLPALDNPHDPHAVLVTWRDLDIGHLPRGRNEAIWRYLATRAPLAASISGIGGGPHGAVEIVIR